MSRPSDAVRITVVGSGTAAPDAERACSGYFIEAGSVLLLLDCGPAVVQHLARFGLAWQRITDIALTHFHTDHIGDLPMLFFALRHGMPPGRTEPIRVTGPAGTRELFGRLAHSFGDHMHDPGFPVVIHEIGDSEQLQLSAEVSLSAHATPHTECSVAYRVDTPAGAICYTGDTGYSEEVASFLRSAEVLISECSLPDESVMETHLTPSKLARMATVALPGRLLVTHVYPSLEHARIPGLLEHGGWTGSTIMAFDGLSLFL